MPNFCVLNLLQKWVKSRDYSKQGFSEAMKTGKTLKMYYQRPRTIILKY